MSDVAVSVKDASTSALIPVDGVVVASAGVNPTSGQAIRQAFALGDGGGATNFAAVNSSGQMSTAIYSRSVNVKLNPTVTASSAYTAGYVVGGLLSFTSAFGAANSGLLESIVISLKSVQTCGFKLYLFTDNPSGSTTTDKAALSVAAADITKQAGVYTLASTIADSGGGTSTVYNLDAIGKVIVSASTTLYAVLVTTATPTFAATSDVFVTVGIIQD